MAWLHGKIHRSSRVHGLILLSVCGELELPIILHHLIEYFGHPNALICALAYSEVSHEYHSHLTWL